MSWLGEARPGGFARHTVVPVTSLVTCPTHLEPAIAVLAEPLAVAMHAVSRLSRRPDDALIIGYGPIGALVHLELVRRWPGLAVSISEPAADRRRLGLALGALPAPSSRRQQGGPEAAGTVPIVASAWWSTPPATLGH